MLFPYSFIQLLAETENFTSALVDHVELETILTQFSLDRIQVVGRDFIMRKRLQPHVPPLCEVIFPFTLFMFRNLEFEPALQSFRRFLDGRFDFILRGSEPSPIVPRLFLRSRRGVVLWFLGNKNAVQLSFDLGFENPPRKFLLDSPAPAVNVALDFIVEIP